MAGPSVIITTQASTACGGDLAQSGPEGRSRWAGVAGGSAERAEPWITITGLVHWFLLHLLDVPRFALGLRHTGSHHCPSGARLAGLWAAAVHRHVSCLVGDDMAGCVADLHHGCRSDHRLGIRISFLISDKPARGAVALYCAAILILLVLSPFWMGDRWLPGRQSGTSRAG